MTNCIICGGEAPEGRSLDDKCLNNWQTVRGHIQAQQTKALGKATAETQPVMQREMKRLEKTWRTRRMEIDKIIGNWAAPINS